MKIHQTLAETVLPLNLQGLDVKIPVFLHIFAERQKGVRPVARRAAGGNDGSDLGIKDLTDHIVFILEMVVEGIAADVAVPGDIAHRDIFKIPLPQQLPEPLGHHIFCEFGGGQSLFASLSAN